MTAGGTSTDSEAASVVADPATFVRTARNWLPVSPVAVEATVYEASVAPSMLDHVLPPSVERCHWNPGGGEPLPDALNVAAVPASTVAEAGWPVTVGGISTFSVAACVVIEPTWLDQTAR